MKNLTILALSLIGLSGCRSPVEPTYLRVDHVKKVIQHDSHQFDIVCVKGKELGVWKAYFNAPPRIFLDAESEGWVTYTLIPATWQESESNADVVIHLKSLNDLKFYYAPNNYCDD